jgi:anionic cell wall polymer biosynthesis LytR-Cps2A-Psr (LCP) family protein
MTGKRRAGRDPIRKPATLIPPPSPSVVIAPIPTRRQARLERRKQQRRRIGVTGGIAIAVVVLIVIGAAIFGAHRLASKKSGPSRTQTTLLVQLEAPNHTALSSVLLAHDPKQNMGVEVLVPARIISDVCGYNSLNFGDILALPNGEVASRQALSSMLGNITIDGSWILPPAELAKLVDALGGITVDTVDVNVVRPTGGGGGQVLVAAGSNVHLNGNQAVEYATYTASPHEAAEAELARLNEVVDATVAALPRTETAIAALLRQLGPDGASSIGATRLAGLLAGLASAERVAGHVLPTDLPFTQIDAGGAQPSYRLDPVGAKGLVTNSLAASVPPGANVKRPSVELLNGVGTPGLVATTCPKLAAHHLTYAGSGNAASFDIATSTVEVSNSNVDLGYQVAAALGLPNSDVRRSSEDQSVADAIVTLGRDYKP